MQNKSASQYLSHLLIAIGVLILSMIIFGMLANLICTKIFGVDPLTVLNLENQVELNPSNVNAARLYMGITSIGSFIVSSLIVIVTFQKRFIEYTGLGRSPRMINVAIGILLLVGSIPLVNWLLELNQNIPIPASTFKEFLKKQEELSNFTYDVILTGNTGWTVVMNVFLLGLIPAIGEELFFRGILMRVFKSLMNNIHVGIWFSSLLFALLHVQVLKFAPMVLLGALFGYVYYLSGSLWVPIIMHFINNSIAVIADHLGEPHSGTSIMNEEAGTAWYLVLLSTLVITALFYTLKKLNPNPPDLQIE